MTKLSTPPKPEEQIRPDELVRTIKKEKPAAPGERLRDIPVTPENYKKFKGESNRRARLPRGIVWGILGLVVFFVVGSIISFYVVKEKVKQSITEQTNTLKAGVADLQNLDPQSAAQEFAALEAGSSTPGFESLLGVFGSLFAGGRNAVSSFGDLAQQLAMLSGEASSFENGLFNPASSTESFVSQLTSLRATLGAIDGDSNQLSGFGGNGFYLPLKAKIEGADNFLDAFIPWLATSTPHHILVLFQNTSEMRPGGGFLGSYADVTVASGTIANVVVHDIADVDVAFKPNIVPPLPLQLEGARFRPADANWFFDFPTSASETIGLFGRSGLYSSTTFDGAIAITPQVVSDLLSVTGPITVSSTAPKSKIAPTIFAADNFLEQIQNIVQQGQAQTATYPKAVLGELSSAIFQQLASSTVDQRQQLFGDALAWITNRDVMGYFTNTNFENFVASYDGAGDVYQLPQNFNGDYLALADADINSDKSELYIAQTVSLDAQIGADGTITDTLKIARTHNGNQSKYWWYQTANQDYLQVFVPDGSSLTNENGGVTKKIVAPVNYALPRNGYSTDPTIVAIASSTTPFLLYPAVTAHEENGKEVFATWTMTHAGKTTSLEFDYVHHAFVPPGDGVQYQFVFEKQAGTTRSYNFEIDAPLGYVFAENGLATYDYVSSDPPGRLIIDLTLQKI